MWFESPQRRLASWRTFRQGLDVNDLSDTCHDVCKWWGFAPMSNISLDPYDIQTWPSVWEMLHRGNYCKFSTAIGMEYTLFYIDEKIENRIIRVYDEANSDIYMTALIDGRWLLNYNLTEVADWSSVKDSLQVQESFLCKDVVAATKHNLSV
jgi:hypothetical protein